MRRFFGTTAPAPGSDFSQGDGRMDIIEIEHLGHRFSDGTIGLREINMRIPKGSLVVIAGPNGSGKTTLLKHLNGLLLPDTGSVKVDGIEVSKNLARARQMVGMIFQDADSQIVGETVAADIAFGPENLRLEPAEIDRRVAAVLHAVGLETLSERNPHMLSGGEKRRLAIAGVLAMDPAVVVFDEPFSSLDFPGEKQLLRAIDEIHQSGRTVLIATHDLDKIIKRAGRIIIMQHGSIVRDGAPLEVVAGIEKYDIRPPLNRIIPESCR